MNIVKQQNPYKPGSFAHQEFNTFVDWYSSMTLRRLVEQAAEYRKLGRNYCAYSWSQMLDWNHKAEVMERLARTKFSEPFTDLSS